MSANAATASPMTRRRLASDKNRNAYRSPKDGLAGERTPKQRAKENIWPVVPLGEIAEVKLGKMLDKTKHQTGRKFPYLRNINVRWGVVDTDNVFEMHFEDNQVERFSLRAGDVLVCEGGEPGRAAVWNGQVPDMKFQKAIHRVRFNVPFEARLLVYLLESMAKSGGLERRFTGSTIKHFTREAFIQLPVPFPPEEQQRKIVAEIEKQFTRLEAGVAALRRVQVNLKRYRAAVLKAAIVGSDWPSKRLEDLVENNAKILYGILQPGPDLPEGVSYVRPTEINNHKIVLDGIRKTSSSIAAKYKRSVLKAGDIILSIVGTIGKVAIVPPELEGGNITQSSVRIRPNRIQIDGKFLSLVLRSPVATRQYDAARLGTAVPRLNVAHVRDLLVPLPPLAEQTRIVAEVERRLSVIEEMESAVAANLQRATRLRHSILQKAFAGNSKS